MADSDLSLDVQKKEEKFILFKLKKGNIKFIFPSGRTITIFENEIKKNSGYFESFSEVVKLEDNKTQHQQYQKIDLIELRWEGIEEDYLIYFLLWLGYDSCMIIDESKKLVFFYAVFGDYFLIKSDKYNQILANLRNVNINIIYEDCCEYWTHRYLKYHYFEYLITNSQEFLEIDTFIKSSNLSNNTTFSNNSSRSSNSMPVGYPAQNLLKKNPGHQNLLLERLLIWLDEYNFYDSDEDRFYESDENKSLESSEVFLQIRSLILNYPQYFITSQKQDLINLLSGFSIAHRVLDVKCVLKLIQ